MYKPLYSIYYECFLEVIEVPEPTISNKKSHYAYVVAF